MDCAQYSVLLDPAEVEEWQAKALGADHYGWNNILQRTNTFCPSFYHAFQSQNELALSFGSHVDNYRPLGCSSQLDKTERMNGDSPVTWSREETVPHQTGTPCSPGILGIDSLPYHLDNSLSFNSPDSFFHHPTSLSSEYSVFSVDSSQYLGQEVDGSPMKIG